MQLNFVEPIRDPEVVRSMAHYFKEQNERDYIMFMVGIYTGKRISDILKIRISDVKNRNTINIREKKTGKQSANEINPILKKVLKEYCKDKDPEEYLIKSRKKTGKPMNRSTAYRILNKAAYEFGLENIGNHTLRKTFGYHFYKEFKDVATLMEIFNHSDPSVTLRYIGINQETANQAIKRLKIY
jgi:integrase